ncbi:hypothetical protein [Nocardioides sp. BYT-33-1]|uniref:hypothetical protein n=1 Tax=Nocardioides sp. BYT-33-1 TaxID=3416952 RepID=UPI003F539608
MSPPTTASRSAAALTGVLGACQLWSASGGTHASMTAAVLAPLTLFAAFALARRNCLEARLASVLAVTAPLLLTILSISIGLPGQSRHPFGAAALVGLLVPFAVLVAVDADRRRRTRRVGSAVLSAGSPYAR